MHQSLLFMLCAIVVVFCGVVYLAIRSWPKITTRRRIASIFFLMPHLLLIACIVVSLSCGHPAQGSVCFNRQFFCGILIVFILPLPTLAGTLTAFVLLLPRARRVS